MENLDTYLIKSATLLLSFYCIYHLLLKKDTFFNSNRWFLLLGLFCAAFLPFLTFQKTVWIEAAVSNRNLSSIEPISLPIDSVSQLELNVFPWEMVLGMLYGIGLLIFMTQLLIEFYSLKKIIRNKRKIKSERFELIEVDEAISPFSFFNKIIYNPGLFQVDELENIIAHEKIHAKQMHSLDVLIARIFCIMFWWNPLVWLYKKTMVQNLEFIADQNAWRQTSDKKSYLLTLLKITTATNQLTFTNHFYQSLIKNRIVMLQKNQSRSRNSWKYVVVIPVLALFIWQFQIKVIAQEKQIRRDLKEQKLSLIEHEVTALSTNQELEESSKLFDQQFGAQLRYTKIKRNKKGEITGIKVALKQKYSKSDLQTVYEVSKNVPIKSFKVYVGFDPNEKVEFGYGVPKKYHTAKLASIENDSASSETAFSATNLNTALSDFPEPPTPPDYPKPPAAPNFPTPPEVPVVPNTNKNKKVWTKFHQQMETFKKQMDSNEMKKFIKETQNYADKMTLMEQETLEFQRQIKAYQQLINEFNERKY